ncbi:MarR family transcriptional regulator [Elizabethkingia miricola]|uniref:DNA-binding MarR family transcriptional regulator n=1 Tax=Elizabethkingia miricola TaxID=172045 RepID=A0ABY3NH27_ELIMR|nr:MULTISPECIES: helix-turn-helix domain-containing protein [Elizabethkingia]NHQ67638.1 MarR family transcriptional regulator [Elizabethkingia miricola]NHQ72377.1 MarR family transcriptional regulator [Elizabethkingia miricola]NHQ79440.1 MarR family transcriptional regulator [Elizabethkingia miricola]OBS12771.1 MarR family transcriptional regulator [Elizabethkingia miricola]PSL89860.1 MarR family transcriptional regulator [Elizabethkingia miricola]
MDYTLLKDTIKLVEQFEADLQKSNQYDHNIESFKRWVADQITEEQSFTEPYWEGKENKRTPESAISTLIVHMNRYAKTYSKSAIYGSSFSTQEEFIYLINLRAFGGMTKMELIKKNIQEKPAGIQIINRLLQQGWIEQSDSSKDKRSKIIQITIQGLHTLDAQMNKIRQATQIVAGNLTRKEKMKLIELLNKLNEFHHPIFTQNIETSELLDSVIENNFKVL